MQKLILLFSFILSIPLTATAYAPCEINFVKYINGEMPADLAKNPAINLWDERFDANQVQKQLATLSTAEKEKYILELSKLVHKDTIYNKNLSSLVNLLSKEKNISKEFVVKNFINKEFEHARFYYSKINKDLAVQVNVDPEKFERVNKLIKNSELSPQYKEDYEHIFLQSQITADSIDIAVQSGLRLRQNPRDFEQLKNYLEFLDNTRQNKLKKGLQNIEEIYNYSYKHGLLPYNPLQKPHIQFLEQMSRLKDFTKRRIQEVERTFKLQQRNGVVTEIDEAVEKEANGYLVHIQEKLRLKKRIEDEVLPSSLKKRAIVQAKHETNIYRKILNGCNSGSSQRIEGAKKKFSRFKFALALGVAPTFYITKNYDKKDTDPFFWEKLGHEIVLGIFFTMVGNKIFTNTNSTFWGKYIDGYIKFGALSYMEAWSYEELFGGKSLIRHFQQIYKGQLTESELEKEFQKLKESKDFEKEVKELLSFLDEKSKLNNTKNFLDKYFNLSTYSSMDENLKITQEDLESEEAREMMMELLAERIYLNSMGDWPLFQVGSKDLDRFAFYRTRNLLWDIEGLVMNLAIFELMCREPFGKIGSWGAIISMIVAEKYLTGDITYQYRREAINQ